MAFILNEFFSFFFLYLRKLIQSLWILFAFEMNFLRFSVGKIRNNDRNKFTIFDGDIKDNVCTHIRHSVNELNGYLNTLIDLNDKF